MLFFPYVTKLAITVKNMFDSRKLKKDNNVDDFYFVIDVC